MPKIRLILTLAAISLLSPAWAVAIAPMTPLDAPLFASVTVTNKQQTASEVSHNFTMTLPKRTGKQFAKLSFSFNEPGASNKVVPIRFNLSSTQTFWGTSGSGRAIAIDSAWIDETGTLWIEFKQPVASGSTITVALKTQKSSTGKPIEYGIAAYPKAGNSTAIFVGSGTLVVSR